MEIADFWSMSTCPKAALKIIYLEVSQMFSLTVAESPLQPLTSVLECSMTLIFS